MVRNILREQIISEFIKSLQEDKIPWKQGWNSLDQPINALTGTKYKGVNSVWLSYVSGKQGYKDNRWCTFNQAAKKGWKVSKGSKGTPIEYWSKYDRKDKKVIDWKRDEELRNELSQKEYSERVTMVTRIYTVFNASQIEGIPAIQQKNRQIDKAYIESHRDKLIENLKVGFKEEGIRAYYSPGLDEIHMPEMDMFDNEYEYLATLLHEAGHSTGHESRLDRNIKNVFGTPEYAKEELRAEISSAFVAQELKVDEVSEDHIRNHKAYIQSWIKVLKDDPDELFRAIKDAQNISDYIIEKGEFKEIEEKINEEDKIIITHVPVTKVITL